MKKFLVILAVAAVITHAHRWTKWTLAEGGQTNITVSNMVINGTAAVFVCTPLTYYRTCKCRAAQFKIECES